MIDQLKNKGELNYFNSFWAMCHQLLKKLKPSFISNTFLRTGFSSRPGCYHRTFAAQHSADLLSELMVQEGIYKWINSWIKQHQHVNDSNMDERDVQSREKS